MSVAEEAKEFQDTILRSVEQHVTPYLVKLGSVDYVMFPETFNPNYAKASLLLLNHLDVEKGDIVLDPFTGCGADAIFAVLYGASRAVAIDKFTMPYLCARYNANRLGLEDKVEVRQGDLFDVLDDDEKFSLVVANPPFKCMEPDSNIASAVRDKEYATLQRFWREVGDYLTPDGRVRAVFSNVGDIDYFIGLAKDNGFRWREIAETVYATKVEIKVFEFKRS
jgi:methylase of polypeptide subunit release factors